MKVVITGGAGFIGSSLAELLEAQGHEVHIIDDFSTGRDDFLANFSGRVHRADITDEGTNLSALFKGADTVYHLAANADVRFGWQDTRRDLRQNVIASLRVAEAARASDVSDVVFSSTGSVYGEARQIPTPEDAAFPEQTSLYGASKVAAEAYLSAFAAKGAFRVTALRFVSVLGPRYTHGHVIDFLRQLRQHPEHLTVLGDGTQRKSYMHVQDCIHGVATLRPSGDGASFAVFNLGVPDHCTVRDSVGWITARLGLAPTVTYGDADRGWVGDNPFIELDVSKAIGQGWKPTHGIQQSVEATVDWINENPWVLQVDDMRVQ